MNLPHAQLYQIALIQWEAEVGIGKAICYELTKLGHNVTLFSFDAAVPDNVDIVFLYGPFGKYLPILQQLDNKSTERRPTVVFWNTEGLPDLRIPWPVANIAGAWRSWIGRLSETNHSPGYFLTGNPPFSLLDAHLLRFRHLGDFFYAQKRGWIDVLADISAVYARFFNEHGLPATVAHFGGFHEWHADLNLERDIDVLWMGKRATKRRSRILDQLREELCAHGVYMHMVDNIENPFVFDEERTELLNRTKITLNLLRTWYDENSLRICMAAANRSLVVSEPLLPHVPLYNTGEHYVSTPIEKLVETILYYLEHPDECLRIANNAHHLLTTTLTMSNSVKTIMDEVNRVRTTAVR